MEREPECTQRKPYSAKWLVGHTHTKTHAKASLFTLVFSSLSPFCFSPSLSLSHTHIHTVNVAQPLERAGLGTKTQRATNQRENGRQNKNTNTHARRPIGHLAPPAPCNSRGTYSDCGAVSLPLSNFRFMLTMSPLERKKEPKRE